MAMTAILCQDGILLFHVVGEYASRVIYTSRDIFYIVITPPQKSLYIVVSGFW